MSDLRPRGVEIELGGKKRNLLLTVNVIDDIQESCNMPLIDAVMVVAGAADGKTDRDTLVILRKVMAAFLNREDTEEITEEEIGDLIHIGNYRQAAAAVLQAYGISVPEPDEDEDESENEDGENDVDPNAGTGR